MFNALKRKWGVQLCAQRAEPGFREQAFQVRSPAAALLHLPVVVERKIRSQDQPIIQQIPLHAAAPDRVAEFLPVGRVRCILKKGRVNTHREAKVEEREQQAQGNVPRESHAQPFLRHGKTAIHHHHCPSQQAPDVPCGQTVRDTGSRGGEEQANRRPKQQQPERHKRALRFCRHPVS